jgi:uncharacterized membrane protein
VNAPDNLLALADGELNRVCLGRCRGGHECLVVICHRVGDFVPAGGRLIETYGGAETGIRAERRLRNMIALGDERTIEQDPAFAPARGAMAAV